MICAWTVMRVRSRAAKPGTLRETMRFPAAVQAA